MRILRLLHPRFEVLERYRAGLLSESAGARVAEHVARCPRCRTVLDEQAALEAVLDAYRPEAMDEASVDDLVAAVLSEQAKDSTAAPVASMPGLPARAGAPNTDSALGLAFAALVLAALVLVWPLFLSPTGAAQGLVGIAKVMVAVWRVLSGVAQALLLVVEPIRTVLLACVVVSLGWGLMVMTRHLDTWYGRNV